MKPLDYLGLAVVALCVAELVMRHLGRKRLAKWKARAQSRNARDTLNA
jgi:hypothetical protein